jgi:hypothetical protein
MEFARLSQTLRGMGVPHSNGSEFCCAARMLMRSARCKPSACATYPLFGDKSNSLLD